MRVIWIAVFGIFCAAAAPGYATDYPWCARSGGTGGNLQCSYATIQQCEASISGVGGSCSQNPLAASTARAPAARSADTRNGLRDDDAPPPSQRLHRRGKHGWYYE